MSNQDNIEKHKWPKGKSGNPKGRPKLPSLVDAISLVLSDKKEDIDALTAILKAMRNKAIKGDVRAAELLLDRGYGKATANIDLTSKGKKISTAPVVVVATEQAKKLLEDL